MKELENIISELVSINRRLANNFKTEEGKELRADLFDITQKLEHYKQAQPLQLLQTGVMCSDIVSDEELNTAFAYANFGKRTKRDVIIDTLKKVAQSWHCGHTSMCIVKELDLVTERNQSYGLTDKGLNYLLSHKD